MIMNYRNGLSYLIDVIGVVTDFHSNPANDTGAVKVTIADKRGICECLLYGEYADQFKDMMYENSSQLPILVLQFVMVKCKQGFVFVETVEAVTRVLLSPAILEVDQFKIEMGYMSVPDISSENQYYSGSKPCKELEFNGLYPHKTLYEFVHSLEDGLFVLCVKIVGLFKVDQWFYPVCHCGDFLEFVAGSYYCGRCHHTVFGTTSKCQLQIALQDSTSCVLLPMFESLLYGIESIENNGSTFALSVDGAKALMVRISDGVDVIRQFYLNDNNFTPTKCIFQTASSDLASDSLAIPPESIFAGKKPLVVDALQTIIDDAAPQYHEKYKLFKIRNEHILSMGGVNVDVSSSNII
ncbi:replication factor-A carboxy-terminal domain protein [Trifolium pratense]|uniref:Replication factor-A carboxy-terminal domain protein n=1 Tax=Trifolium pratense TaxID=57577 RepID=A0A2K3MVI7_TRIPR|nr:replication factor-A carboxy-terminal domain protein [Trifolium pratense]